MYCHASLPDIGDYIRILKLASGNTEDELVGELLVHNLKDAHPEYVATSYVCGNDDRSRHYILVSGLKLGIYKNADEVLRRFRRETESAYLWIDVICIDQVGLIFHFKTRQPTVTRTILSTRPRR